MTDITALCESGDIEPLRERLDAEPDLIDAPGPHGWHPIFHAAFRKQAAVVRLLLDRGADISVGDGYVMHFAGEVPGNQEIVSLLVAHGGIDAHLRPADDLSRQFLSAVFLNEAERVESLAIRHPHLLTQHDGRGDLPIHHAARNGATDIVTRMLAHKADPNARTESGQTVLYCAGGHGHTDTVRVLLDAGADPSVPFTDDGKTLREWLRPYETDEMFAPVVALLDERAATP